MRLAEGKKFTEVKPVEALMVRKSDVEKLIGRIERNQKYIVEAPFENWKLYLHDKTGLQIDCLEVLGLLSEEQSARLQKKQNENFKHIAQNTFDTIEKAPAGATTPEEQIKNNTIL